MPRKPFPVFPITSFTFFKKINFLFKLFYFFRPLWGLLGLYIYYLFDGVLGY